MKRSLSEGPAGTSGGRALSTSAAAAKVELSSARRERVHELPLGVDEHVLAPVGVAARDGLDVLYLAGLEVRKGIHVLLDAFERLAPDMPAARLLLAGDGAERERGPRTGAPHAGAGRRRSARAVDREAARAAMQACAVFCLPSYGDPAPLAAVEAMACGRPVVATDASGLGPAGARRGR